MTLQGQLALLESDGLVQVAQLQPELEYLFRHALIQDAAYRSLVKNDRRILHQAAGEALEQAYTAGLAPVLARHFAEAGDHDRALRYYLQAGQAAAKIYANAEALHHLGRALELATTHPTPSDTVCAIFLQRGRAFELNAQDDEALNTYAALEAWAVAGGHRAALLAALTARATIYVRLTVAQNLPLGQALSQQALALARELGDQPGEAKVLWNLVQHSLAVGRMEEAAAYGDQGLALAEAHGLREQRAYLLTDLVRVYFALEQQERAMAALAEAAAIWRELGTLNMLADNLASNSMVSLLSGNFDQALAHSAEAEQLSRQIGNLWNEAYANYMVDLVHFERGHLGQALAVAERGAALASRAGFSEGQNQGEFDQAMIFGYLGDLPRALELVHQTQARAAALSGVEQSWPLIDVLVPLLYIYNGLPAEAQAALDACHIQHDAEALKRQFVWAQVIITMVRAELALARNDPLPALELIETMNLTLRQNNVRLLLVDCLTLQGRALHAAGQLEAAQAALKASRDEAIELGARRTLWSTLAALADLAAARGDQPGALALRREAAEVVGYIADHAGSSAHGESFRRRPDVAALLRQAGQA